jgi:cholesterol oxidase
MLLFGTGAIRADRPELGVAMNGNGRYAAVVIGSGFGGTLVALTLAREFQRRNRGEQVLMLERGAWWTTPVGTVQDREVETAGFLRSKGQPVQDWASAENFRGFIDLYTRCFRRRKNEDGLYDLTVFGKTGLFGMAKSDGVNIMHASGVGGGSLVYSNITVQPPDLVFGDPRWPLWDKQDRDRWFALARDAIGFGALNALDKADPNWDPQRPPRKPVNTGLSNIVTRTVGLDPGWRVPPTVPGAKQLDPAKYPDEIAAARADDLWIDRGRILQLKLSKYTQDYGSVDLAIGDKPVGADGKPKNYCERQGRCNVGCLPGARNTLNKQLMAAIHGTFRGDPPQLGGFLELWPLAEVDLIHALPDGGYRIDYRQRDSAKPHRTEKRAVLADKVIIAAGCVGTAELLLRSQRADSIPNLSTQLGHGFSTNGDYLAFLPDTRYRVNLNRGPVTTSYAHFNTPEAGDGGDPAMFHTIEDQGIPRALASLAGHGVPLLRSLSKGRQRGLFVAFAVVSYGVSRIPAYLRALFTNYRTRQEQFTSEDERTLSMMCVVAMGRDKAVGRFRLGSGPRDTTLRLDRTDGLRFFDDPIYPEIEKTLKRFAAELTDDPTAQFQNPFLGPGAKLVGGRSVTLTHPLGGCVMADDAEHGVVDAFGRVFNSTGGVHDGLYVADGSVIPTALGVNPSLTIAAVSLRTAHDILGELNAAGPHPAADATVGVGREPNADDHRARAGGDERGTTGPGSGGMPK